MPHSAPEFSNRQDFAFMKSRMVPSKNYSLNSFMAGIPNVGHGKQNRPQMRCYSVESYLGVHCFVK